jgi:hypothetical protein
MSHDRRGINDLDDALSGLADVQPPASLAPAIVRRVRSDGRPRRWTQNAWRLAGSAAAVGLAAALAWTGLRALPPGPAGSAGASPRAQESIEPTATAVAIDSPPADASPTPPAATATAEITTRPSPPSVGEISLQIDNIRGPLSRRFGATGIWTGSELVIWGGGQALNSDSAATYDDGAAWDPASDTWRSIAQPPIEARRRHLAGWTGQEMLVWGGESSGSALSDGAAYDPTTDSWRSLAASPLEWRQNAAAVWAGSEWVVATTGRDGSQELLEFAAYDPANDAWRLLPSLESRLDTETSLVWTGSEIVVLNANTGLHRLESGAQAWVALPELRVFDKLAWTGTSLFAMNLEYLDTQEPRYRSTLAEWKPDSNEWRLIPDPLGLIQDAGIVAAGTHVLLLAADLVYDTASGQWSTADFPAALDRVGDVRVWLGDRLVVWGGGRGDPSRPLTGGVVITPTW